MMGLNVNLALYVVGSVEEIPKAANTNTLRLNSSETSPL